MSSRCPMKSVRWLFIAMLITMLVASMAPARTAYAQESSIADLAVSLVSIPKHAKACQTFEVIYTITNLGPDPATNLYLQVSIPDAYQDLDVLGLPETLAVGQTATVSVVIKVLVFEPGETRRAWVGVELVSFDSLDPNLDNNTTTRTPMRIIGKYISRCP